jgi:hypothetical protein
MLQQSIQRNKEDVGINTGISKNFLIGEKHGLQMILMDKNAQFVFIEKTHVLKKKFNYGFTLTLYLVPVLTSLCTPYITSTYTSTNFKVNSPRKKQIFSSGKNSYFRQQYE